MRASLAGGMSLGQTAWFGPRLYSVSPCDGPQWMLGAIPANKTSNECHVIFAGDPATRSKRSHVIRSQCGIGLDGLYRPKRFIVK